MTALSVGVPAPPTDSEPLCYLCAESKRNGEAIKESRELRINCTRCDRPYCENHASRIDPQFCKECCKDFSAEQNAFSKTSIEELLIVDPSGEKPEKILRFPVKSHCKQIRLIGTDWMFYELSIAGMSDSQLENALQWHRAAVSEIELERTERRVKHAQKESKEYKIKPASQSKSASNNSTAKPDRNVAKLMKGLEQFVQIFGKDKLPEIIKSIQDLARQKKEGTA